MFSVEKFSVLLHQLQQIDRTMPRDASGFRAQGDAILKAFLRYAEYEVGAVYLAESSSARSSLAASSDGWQVPECIEWKIPDDVMHAVNDGERLAALPGIESFSPQPHALIPLRRSDSEFGLVALRRSEGLGGENDEVLLLRAAASYLTTILSHQRMTSEVREGDFQLKYRLWELESLYDIGLSISSTLNLDELVEEVLMRAVSLLNARRAALYLKKGQRFALVHSFGDVRGEFFDEEVDPELSRKLVSDREAIRFDEKADCIFPGCETFVALPIQTNTEVVGVLAAADRELRNGGVGAFEEGDVRLLSRFASQAGIALENARLHREALEKQKMERELELAATIQQDILPRSIPVIDGLEIDAWTRPAKQLGGDYHALFESDGAFTFCVADVSGKSTPAALLVSTFHAALQLLLAEGRSLGEIATELNRHIHHWSSQTKFITLIIATFDRESEIIRFVNAGHNPGYLINGDRIEELPSHGLPVGMMAGTTYKTMMRPFPAGSLAFFYSDGITEAESPEEDEYGNKRLEDVLARYKDASCAEIMQEVLRDVDEFVKDAPQTDDQTVVLVRRTD